VIGGVAVILLIMKKMSLKKRKPSVPTDTSPKSAGSASTATSEPSGEEQLLKKFQDILKISNRVKKAEVSQYLDIPEKDLFSHLVTWGKSIPFKIEGDEILVADIQAFTAALDHQFAEWEQKEHSKEGKREL
jgi:hypothetical protein